MDFNVKDIKKYWCQRYSTSIWWYFLLSLDRAIVITNSYFTEAAYQLAAVNDILLIDRQKLLKMLKKSKLFSSQIPFYCYIVDIFIIGLFYYIYLQLRDLIYLSICLFHLLLLIYMFFKTLRYKKYNQIKYIPIQEE